MARFLYKGACRIHGYSMEFWSDCDLGDNLTFNCPKNGRHKKLKLEAKFG